MQHLLPISQVEKPRQDHAVNIYQGPPHAGTVLSTRGAVVSKTDTGKRGQGHRIDTGE